MQYKILVIEDNLDMLDNICELLSLNQFVVKGYSSGKKALEEVESFMPDLIICDIMMPEMDGYAVYEKLQDSSNTCHIPFIFLTAKADKQDIRKGMNLGADDYITKPFEEKDLLQAIQTRIEKKQSLEQSIKEKLQNIQQFLTQIGTIETLSDTKNRRIKKLDAKEDLYTEGTTPQYLYFLCRGKIKEYITHEDGKEYITNIYKEGDFFGYLPLISNENYIDNTTALEPSEVALIPKHEFSDLIYKNAEVARKFIRLLVNQSEEKEKKLVKLAYDSVRKRVADTLLHLGETIGKKQPDNTTIISITRQDLASFVGTATESVIRILSEFKKDHYIDITGREIILLKPDILKKMPF